MWKVMGSQVSLKQVKAEGGDIRLVYSPSDAAAVAKREPDKEFVFFAVGFETTTPATALEILKGPPPNLSFLISHRRIPPAMELLHPAPDCKKGGQTGKRIPTSSKERRNIQARKVIDEVFEVEDGYWRGIGRIPNSGLRLRDRFAPFDACKRYGIQKNSSSIRELLPGCQCHLGLSNNYYSGARTGI